MKKVEDITDVTGGSADLSDVGDVIDEVVNDIKPITILTDDNFANTTGISDSGSPTDDSPTNDSPTNDSPADDKKPGWIVTSAECKNREKCDKVKQTIVGNKDGIDEVTNGTVQFGTVQTTDRNWLIISRLWLEAYDS